MKAKALLTKIKSGIKDYDGMDIEGDIINENLEYMQFKNCYFNVDFSGTVFQHVDFINCNLKSCHFNYTRIKNTEFNNCLMDGTDFSFAKINELTLNHVSYYDTIITGENFDLLRDDETIGFHIRCIEHGWFSLYLYAHKCCIEIDASSYLNNDAPRKVLKTLIDFYQSNMAYGERWVCFDDEPGVTIMKLVKKKDLIQIIISDGKVDAHQIPKEEISLDNYMGNVKANINTDLHKMSRAYIKAYEKILNNIGFKAYEAHWFETPNLELDMLKELIKHNL